MTLPDPLFVCLLVQIQAYAEPGAAHVLLTRHRRASTVQSPPGLLVASGEGNYDQNGNVPTHVSE